MLRTPSAPLMRAASPTATPTSTTPAPHGLARRAQRLSPQTLGWLLGGLGVLIVALSIPMTRLASGSLAAPQLPAVFVAIGRAGLLAAGWLLATWPTAPVRAAAWGGFLYVSVFSMWLGFFAWYCGLALGGMLRVSQIQLLQPFLSMVLAVPLLGESLSPATLGFSLAVLATVFLSRRMAVSAARPAATSSATSAAFSSR